MDWKDYDQACEIMREILYKEMQAEIERLRAERDRALSRPCVRCHSVTGATSGDLDDCIRCATCYRELEERCKLIAAERDRAREVAVWAVRKGVMVGHDECVRPCIWFDVHRGVEHDGTDASIYAALEGAMGGK